MAALGRLLLILAGLFCGGCEKDRPAAAPAADRHDSPAPASLPPPAANREAGSAAARPPAQAEAAAVMVGEAGPELDACPAAGRIAGLNPRGDNFLAVRSAPRADAPEIDRLRAGDQAYMCGRSKDGRWESIVYQPGGALSADCGVGSHEPRPRAYRGPCRSGWVASRYIELFAG